METKAPACDVTVLENAPCAVRLSISVPVSDVAQETDRVFAEIQRTARVPGFRPGKAPGDMVRKNYIGSAREQVIGNLIQRTAFEALKSQGVAPIDGPSIDTVDFDFDKPFTYTLTAERHPECKPKNYTGIPVERPSAEVTDAMIDENLGALRERNARVVESSDQVVDARHLVIVDYECLDDGQPLKNIGSKNYMMDLSASQMIPGLKEGVMGVRVGETKDIPVTFPADYPAANLAGKSVVFRTTVTAIKQKSIPALDDDFAKDLGFEGLSVLREKVRESLVAEEKKRQSQAVERQVTEHLVKANVFPVPSSLVEHQLSQMWDRTVDYFKRRGIPSSTIEGEKAAWREKYRAEAENTVRLSYILSAIARAESIAVDDADVARERQRLEAANPGHEADIAAYMTEHADRIRVSLKEEKLFAFLLSKAVIKDVPRKQ